MACSTPLENLPPGEPVNLVLLGKTGHGKSATANSIFGRKVFNSRMAHTSVTTKCQLESDVVGGRMINLVDTPGTMDTKNPDATLKEIGTAIAYRPEGFHAFLLVLRPDMRMTAEEWMSITLLKNLFGKDILKKYTILVFTRGDVFEDDEDRNGKSLLEWLNCQGPEICKLVAECNKRCFIINNKEKDTRTIRKQVIELISFIDMLVKENSRQMYSNELFQLVQNELQKEEEKIKQEKERIEKEEKELKAKVEEDRKKLEELEKMNKLLEEKNKHEQAVAKEKIKQEQERIKRMEEELKAKTEEGNRKMLEELEKTKKELEEKNKRDQAVAEENFNKERERINKECEKVKAETEEKMKELQKEKKSLEEREENKHEQAGVAMVDAAKESGKSCFPPDALVKLEDGKIIAMADLHVGHKVLSSVSNTKLEYSEVYFFAHLDPWKQSQYICICASKYKLKLTPDHHIFTVRTHNTLDTVPAEKIKIGDRILIFDETTYSIQEDTVTNLSRSTEIGIYAPITMSGSIIVDNVLVSCYVNTVPPKISHFLLWPMRKLYHFSPSLSTWVNIESKEGMPIWVQWIIKCFLRWRK